MFKTQVEQDLEFVSFEQGGGGGDTSFVKDFGGAT